MSQVTLNQDKCIGCRQCISVCPQVFEFDQQKMKATIKGGEQQEHQVVKEVNGSKCIEKAAEGCPMNAIKVA